MTSDDGRSAVSERPGEWNVAERAAPIERGPVGRLLAFAWQEKAWWIVPMVVTLVALFSLVWFASRQQVAPFFYAVNG